MRRLLAAAVVETWSELGWLGHFAGFDNQAHPVFAVADFPIGWPDGKLASAAGRRRRPTAGRPRSSSPADDRTDRARHMRHAPAAILLAATFALALALALAPVAADARTFDEFQVFDGRVAEPGNIDFNQHLNLGRRGRSDDGAPRNGMLLTTEIGYATTPWHEVALLLPVAREFSGDVFGGGFKLRNSFVVPGAENRPFAYGFDVELRHQSTRFSDTNWGLTLRPILDFRSGPWQLILNPQVEFPIGRGGPVFSPAVRGVRQVAERAWIGLEHYMDFGRVNRIEATAAQAHQVFVTTDFRLGQTLGLHLGLGHGLTHASDRWAGKVILSFDF